MSLTHIGPIELGAYDHGNPTFGWTSDVSPAGIRGASIGGLLTWAQAKQLGELVDNFDRAVTLGGVTGVLEWINFTGSLFADFSGWYLLAGHSFDPTKAQTMDASTGPFSLSASFLGASREPTVVFSSRLLANDFGLTGEPLLVDPFWSEDATGATDGMLVSVGGRSILREYDETSPMVFP